jgi:arabinose-5-phosphate isomerase
VGNVSQSAIDTESSSLVRARQVFDTEILELSRLRDRLDAAFEQAVDSVRRSVEAGGKVIVVGVGKCSHIGDKIAATLTSTGSPAIALNSLNALHGDLGIVKDGDTVLCLSSSGETVEMLNLLPALRRFDVRIVSFTGNVRSSLARHSDVVVDVSVEHEACPLALAPTSSTTAMLVLGDALAMTLLEASGFQPEDFARFHPGGSLGRKLLTKAADIMRPRDQMPFIAPSTTVPDALDAMTRQRAGAAVVVDAEDRLAGIFTHGDFVRAFRAHGPEISFLTVESLMTPSPVCIEAGQLAVEVLAVLKKHRIDDIVVLDEERKPVGLIDVQDLSRIGLF